MMSRKKALDDVEQGQESFCCLLSAWVSVDSISLTHARLAGFGWTTFPRYAKPMHCIAGRPQFCVALFLG
jgi:hypothetical protein